MKCIVKIPYDYPIGSREIIESALTGAGIVYEQKDGRTWECAATPEWTKRALAEVTITTYQVLQ